jgi:hypothetical protein
MNSPGRRKELDEEQELLDSLDRTLYYGNSKCTPRSKKMFKNFWVK